MLLTLLFPGWRKRADRRIYRLTPATGRGMNLALAEDRAALILPDVRQATTCCSAPPEAVARIGMGVLPAVQLLSEVSHV